MFDFDVRDKGRGELEAWRMERARRQAQRLELVEGSALRSSQESAAGREDEGRAAHG